VSWYVGGRLKGGRWVVVRRLAGLRCMLEVWCVVMFGVVWGMPRWV
jgi:hypothetical protein